MADADVRSATTAGSWPVEEFLALATGPATVRSRPFDDDAVAFCAALSKELLAGQAARTWPQLAALGYWLRPASVARIRARYGSVATPGIVTVPRGVVLHITPGNVDTMFVYSWVLSLLTGNTSIVRVSDRDADSTSHLLTTVADVLERPEFAAVRERSYLIHTDHDDAVSAALSAVADVRVVWGGDDTVARFRTFPLPPRGRDVTFPDRHSIAILDTAAVCRADDDQVLALGESLFNDAYWFDQGGCSSPRLVVWSGSADVDGARRRLRGGLRAAVERRGYQVEVGTAIEKTVRGLRAASVQDDVRLRTDSNETTWVELPDLSHYDRETTGGGLFFDVVSSDLGSDLAAFVGPKDQTAACFGLEASLVTDLARRLEGRGIDRFVAMGRALEFDAVWDGYDLCQEFVKRVVVDV